MALVAGACGGSSSAGHGSSARLILTDDALYWVDPTMDAIRTKAKGGDVETLVSGAGALRNGVNGPNLAVNGDALFYVRPDGLARVPLDGGMPEIVAQGSPPLTGLAADDGHVFWAPTIPTMAGSVELEDVPAGGGSAHRLGTRDSAAISLAVDGGTLFGTSCAPDGVWKMPRGGGSPTTLATGAACPTAVALDGEAVYVHDDVSGLTGVWRIPKGGGDATLVFGHAGAQSFDAIVLDGGSLYTGYLESDTVGVIVRVPAEGGEAVEVVRGGAIVGLAVDEALVWWTELDAQGAVVLNSAAK